MSNLIDREKVISRVNDLMRDGKVVSQVEISKELGLSRQTFYNIMKENDIDIKEYNIKVKKGLVKSGNGFEIYHPESRRKFNFSINSQFMSPELKKSPAPEPINPAPEPIKNDELVILDKEKEYDYKPNSSPALTVALISNRHDNIDNSITKAIYRGPVKADLIHNYSKLYEIADEFICKNLIPAGYTKLDVIVTGLTQCVVAVIKASIANNITLTLLHYDNVTGRYNKQAVCGEVIDAEPSLLDLIYAQKKNYTFKLIGHDAEYFKKLKSIYIIKVENLNRENESVIYITDNLDKMFSKYSESIQEVLQLPLENYRVLADELTFGATNMESRWNRNFGTFYNQPKK